MEDPEDVFAGICDDDEDVGHDQPAHAHTSASDPAKAGLSSQLQHAEARCEILERNLSCLFTTARLEIQRKNDEISHLRAM